MQKNTFFTWIVGRVEQKCVFSYRIKCAPQRADGYKMMKKRGIVLLAAALLAAVAFSIWATGSGSRKGEKRKDENRMVKIGVCVYKGSDTFIASIISQLEQTMKDTEQKHNVSIKLDIADAKESQTTQNEQVERYISLDYDVICVNTVDRTSAASLIDLAVEADIPLVFFNREPVAEDIYRSNHIYYIGSDAKRSAVLQGEMVLDAYRENSESIDSNGNGMIEYIMLEGEAGHQDTIIRAEYSVRTLEEHGMKLKKIAGWSANFDRNQAAALMEQWFEQGGEEPELILSNNDDMALGAVDAIDKLDKRSIAIVGIDGIPAGIEAVQQGKMLGTVVSDATVYANDIFLLSYALARKEPIPESLAMEDEKYIWVPWRTYTAADAEK